jgi:hypothetical protein
MKQMSLTTVAIATSTFACAALLTFGWSEQRGLSLSVEKAEARVGRPLTPVSVAGVARRHNRRAYYGAGAVGAGAVAVGMGRYAGGPNNGGGLVGGDDSGIHAGAAAVGTAGAVAATSPNWGWGGGAGYYAGGPYYGGGIRGANAAYYGGYPSAAGITPTSHYAVRAYYAGGPWYNYSGWDDYQARNGIACKPGTLTKLDDGQMYVCQ